MMFLNFQLTRHFVQVSLFCFLASLTLGACEKNGETVAENPNASPGAIAKDPDYQPPVVTGPEEEQTLSVTMTPATQKVMVGVSPQNLTIAILQNGVPAVESSGVSIEISETNCPHIFRLAGAQIEVLPSTEPMECSLAVIAVKDGVQSPNAEAVVQFLEDFPPQFDLAELRITATLGDRIEPRTLAARDPEGDNVTYTIDPGTCGSKISLEGATLSFLQELTQEPGNCTAAVVAWDEELSSDPLPIIIEILPDAAPTLQVDLPRQTTTPGTNIQPVTLLAEDADGDAVHFSLGKTNCPDLFRLEDGVIQGQVSTDAPEGVCRVQVIAHARALSSKPVNIEVVVRDVPRDFLLFCGDETFPKSVRSAVLAVAQAVNAGNRCEVIFERLKRVRTLDLTESKLENIEPLGFLPELRQLHLGRNRISDLSPLSSLTGLQELHIERNAVTNVDALAKLTSLRTLNLSMNGVSDVRALSHLTQLQKLDLSANEIEDASPLSSLRWLTKLNISRNKLEKLDGVEFLSQLTYLDISENPLSGLQGLANLTRLEILDAGKTRANDISALANLRSLQFLYLGNNEILDVAPLASLFQLHTLDLQHNRLADIEGLVALVALKNLNLAGNDLVSLTALAALGELEYLFVQDNEVVDATPLAGLSRLVGLRLDGNLIVGKDCPTNSESRELNNFCLSVVDW